MEPTINPVPSPEQDLEALALQKEKAHTRHTLYAFLGGMAAGALIMLLGFEIYTINFQKTTQGRAQLAVARTSSEETASAINDKTVLKLASLEQAIERNYYESDKITREQKEDGIYKGLIESLNDPYSTYYTAKEMEDMNQQLQGYYYGIGAYIGTDKTTGYPKISGVIKDTPAEAAGLEPNDIIYKVNDEKVEGYSLEEVVSRVRGPEDTTVHLTIYRQGEDDYLEFDVTRAEIDATTVASEMLEDQIGYLAIAEFDEVTADQFDENLNSLKEEGMKGLILDLRNNPGGNVDVVTKIANKLVPEGLIFYMEEQNGRRTDYTADGRDVLGLPIVVLVNENSASAAEILSSAIQESGAGTLIGMQTYGKGVVQTVFNLDGGSAMKLTTANYYTRNGNNINKLGVTPDIELDVDMAAYRKDKTDNQYDRALEEIKKLIR